uniref:Uncharacterized protein n=1 Tax=Anguilla anguilla TaxID=7936 RepID=A0A0E9VJ31_ANGAN
MAQRQTGQHSSPPLSVL